jgi:hypothetical protein
MLIALLSSALPAAPRLDCLICRSRILDFHHVKARFVAFGRSRDWHSEKC